MKAAGFPPQSFARLRHYSWLQKKNTLYLACVGESHIPRTLEKIGPNTPKDTTPIISQFEGNKSARIIQAGNLSKIVL